MRIMFFRLIIIVSFVLGLAVNHVLADDASGESALSYLKIARGARMAALGEGGVSLADDSQTLYYNPAGLTFLKNMEVSFQKLVFVESISLTHITYAQPVKWGGLGFGIGYLDSGSMDRYDVNNVKTGDFKSTDYDLFAGISVKLLDNLSAGLTLKLIKEQIDDESVSVFSGDCGLTILNVEDRIIFGLSIQNFGGKVKYINDSFSQPLIIRLGASLKTSSDFIVYCEGLNSSDAGNDLRIGFELPIQKVVFVRGGYKYLIDNDPDLGGTFGLTGGIGFRLYSFDIDYALVPFDDFDLTHRYSLSYRFGNRRSLKKSTYGNNL
ncbi:MAG: PorV/PorQ family protein [bacterium]